MLVPRGRVIVLEPAMSAAGRLIYGNCHHEPLGFNTPLSDQLPISMRPRPRLLRRPVIVSPCFCATGATRAA